MTVHLEFLQYFRIKESYGMRMMLAHSKFCLFSQIWSIIENPVTNRKKAKKKEQYELHRNTEFLR